MEYHDAYLLISCANPSQYPDTTLPEIVFAGRSNAGKSSLINALLNRKNLAYSGKTPGKTQLLNFFPVDSKVMFVDAPGYGFASGGKSQALRFGKVMEPYFTTREQLKALILVMDIRRVPNEEDMMMINYAKQAHIAVYIACSKADKLGPSQTNSQLMKISGLVGIPKQALFPVSSLSKKGIDKLWEKIMTFVE